MSARTILVGLRDLPPLGAFIMLSRTRTRALDMRLFKIQAEGGGGGGRAGAGGGGATPAAGGGRGLQLEGLGRAAASLLSVMAQDAETRQQGGQGAVDAFWARMMPRRRVPVLAHAAASAGAGGSGSAP